MSCPSIISPNPIVEGLLAENRLSIERNDSLPNMAVW